VAIAHSLVAGKRHDVATRALRDPAPLVALSHRQQAINP
jgi:hypothetical protein